MGVVRIASYLENCLLRDSNWQYEKTLPRRDRKFYLVVAVIVVVVHELTYPAGRLCDVILLELAHGNSVYPTLRYLRVKCRAD
jgi:hypothetical protein